MIALIANRPNIKGAHLSRLVPWFATTDAGNYQLDNSAWYHHWQEFRSDYHVSYPWWQFWRRSRLLTVYLRVQGDFSMSPGCTVRFTLMPEGQNIRVGYEFDTGGPHTENRPSAVIRVNHTAVTQRLEYR